MAFDVTNMLSSLFAEPATNSVGTMPPIGQLEPISDRVDEVAMAVAQPEPAAPSYLPVCRCGSTQYRDVLLSQAPHLGQSTRRDCAECRRFLDFPRWHGLDI